MMSSRLMKEPIACYECGYCVCNNNIYYCTEDGVYHKLSYDDVFEDALPCVKFDGIVVDNHCIGCKYFRKQWVNKYFKEPKIMDCLSVEITQRACGWYECANLGYEEMIRRMFNIGNV